MTTELEAPLTARRAIADDVGLDAARFDPDAEARELVVPMLELFGSRALSDVILAFSGA